MQTTFRLEVKVKSYELSQYFVKCLGISAFTSMANLSLIFVVGYQDAASEIAAELQGIPDLIIGNYSDGNLVASLLAYKLGVTQVRTYIRSCHFEFSVQSIYKKRVKILF